MLVASGNFDLCFCFRSAWEENTDVNIVHMVPRSDLVLAYF